MVIQEIIIVIISALAILFLVFNFLYTSAAFASYQEFVDWFFARKGVVVVLFSIMNLALLAIIIRTMHKYFLLFKAAPEKEPDVKPDQPKEEVRGAWEHIRELANSQNPSDWNNAILRADALLNDILNDLGYEGPTFADRLKIVDTTILKSVDRLWSAHRLRNMIAHEPLEQHSRETIIEALRSYEQALRELGLMEEKPNS